MNRYAEIQALYSQLPTIECKGLCHKWCAGIYASPAENEAIRRRKGTTIPDPPNQAYRQMVKAGMPPAEAERHVLGGLAATQVHAKQVCPLLDQITKRCTGYEVRPMICRLWGLTERMKCEHGCEPSRTLTDYEEMKFGFDVDFLGGTIDQETYDKWVGYLNTPETFRLLQVAQRKPDHSKAVMAKLAEFDRGTHLQPGDTVHNIEVYTDGRFGISELHDEIDDRVVYFELKDEEDKQLAFAMPFNSAIPMAVAILDDARSRGLADYYVTRKPL